MNDRNVNRNVRLAMSAAVATLLIAAGPARAQRCSCPPSMQGRPSYYQAAPRGMAYYAQPSPYYYAQASPYYIRPTAYVQAPAAYAQPASNAQFATYAQPAQDAQTTVQRTAYYGPSGQPEQPAAAAAQPQPVAAEPAPAQVAAAPASDPYGFTGWLNSVRAQHGLRSVGYDPNLEAWAAQNNAAQNARGIGHFVMGPARRQNSAMGNYATIGGMWLSSPAHAAALLDPTISFIGLAGSGAYWTFNAY